MANVTQISKDELEELREAFAKVGKCNNLCEADVIYLCIHSFICVNEHILNIQIHMLPKA